MTDFERRAEFQPAEADGQERIPWHLARYRAHVAMCGHHIEPGSQVRPLADVDEPSLEPCCTTCWEWWSTVRLVGEPRGE
ncbi:hypothetical protein [Streptacidiphilus sp. MAP5-52]|uniref:hypothetical protein n=1 Tax=Streptacidiphilus sp. MAP5-52 TaxID=3156267 RepID=UPI0035158C50